MTKTYHIHTDSPHHAAKMTPPVRAGSPRPAAGKGAGGEGLSAHHFRQRQSVLSSIRPPQPQPFSPAKPGEKGAHRNCSRFIFSASTLTAGLTS